MSRVDGIVSVSAFVGGLVLVGIGVGLKDPAWACVVVGGIVLAVVVLASGVRIKGGRRE